MKWVNILAGVCGECMVAEVSEDEGGVCIEGYVICAPGSVVHNFKVDGDGFIWINVVNVCSVPHYC